MASNSGRQVKVGIVGCGPIAQFAHMEACQKAYNVELYALCDQAEDLLNHFVHFYTVPKAYSAFEDMLNDPTIEAVIIATSDPFHLPLSLQAIQAGKHVLVEKPLGDNIETAFELKEILGMQDLVFQVGHMKRLDEGVQYAKNFIEQELGELLALKTWYCDSTHRYTNTNAIQALPLQSTSSRKPHIDPKSDRRKYYMMAHGSHLLDLTRFLGGEIYSLQANLVEKFGAFSWFADVEFASGAHGHLDLTIAVRMDWHEGFEVYGEKGSVLGKLFNPWYFRSAEVQCFSEKEKVFHSPLAPDGHFFRRQVEAWADNILSGNNNQASNIEDGIASIQGMIAMARSVESGKRMVLKEMSGIL